MKLSNIFKELNNNNINKIFELLKKSNDPSAKNILISMINGKNIFQACSDEYGGLISILMLNHNLETLNFLGEYLSLINNIKKQILIIIIYPLISLILIIFIIKILHSFNFPFNKIYLLSLFIIPTTYIFSYIYLKYLFRQFVILYGVSLLYENKVNLEYIVKLFKYFNQHIMKNISQCSSILDLSYLLLGFEAESLQQIQEISHNSYNKINKFIKHIPTIIYISSITSISIILISIMFSIFNMQQNMIQF